LRHRPKDLSGVPHCKEGQVNLRGTAQFDPMSKQLHAIAIISCFAMLMVNARVAIFSI